MEEKKQVKRSIVKENGQFVFITDVPDLVLRKEYVTKENFRKTFDEVKDSQQRARDNLASIEKRLKQVDTEKDEELEKFIALANRASNYNQTSKLKEEKEKALNDLKLLDQQLADMEKIAPELARKSQKK